MLCAGFASPAVGAFARLEFLPACLTYLIPFLSGVGTAFHKVATTVPTACLCSAIESGQWVLLDSANLCNPTVLDRLNPLLEPQGECVWEGERVGGHAVVVVGHR